MSEITFDMLKQVSDALSVQTQQKQNAVIHGLPTQQPINNLTRSLMGSFLPSVETPVEIAKLESALKFLSPDTGRGSGSFYDSKGNAETDYWLAAIWSIASLEWSSTKEIARNWSINSSRYTVEGFEQAWNGYKPHHSNAIGIGSLYKKVMELGWQASNLQAPPATPIIASNNKAKFNLLSLTDLGQLPPSEWLVKGILPSKGLASIYGPSGSGKTFLVLDLAFAIATKTDWFDFKVKNAPVVYIGLEGKSGISNRIQAWRNKNGQQAPNNFLVSLDSFNLMAQAQVEELATTINKSGMSNGLVVIDTLNQASPSADENSSKDMGLNISNLQLLQALTNGLVLIIHHTGKNTAAGLRGHSSLKAALDTNIEVVGGDKRSWLIEKNKDGADGQSFAFKLVVQKIGLDADGDEITSCTVERNHNAAIFQKPEPTGKNQKPAYRMIKDELAISVDLNKCNSGTQTKCLKVETAITKVASTLTTRASNKRSNSARTILTSLIQGGYLNTGLEADEGWLWLN